MRRSIEVRRAADRAEKPPAAPAPKVSYCPTLPKLCEDGGAGPAGHCLACGSKPVTTQIGKGAPRTTLACGKLKADKEAEAAHQASLRPKSDADWRGYS